MEKHDEAGLAASRRDAGADQDGWMGFPCDGAPQFTPSDPDLQVEGKGMES